jgi:hypothetical protein
MLGTIIAISVELILGALLINRIILYRNSKHQLEQERKRTALYEEHAKLVL